MPERSRAHEWTPITLLPLNGGPDPARLADSFLTPTSRFFVRNHGTIPIVDPDAFRLEISGMVRQPLRLSLDELTQRFPTVRRPALIQCAGFRRSELARVRAIPGELPWDEEPVSTAEWGGIRLADLLAAAMPDDAARHVAFEGCDDVEREGRRFGFGGSVTMEEAARHDVILAFEMNGEPLTAEHGWPLRAVVPNVIGARSVKWLTRIELRPTASENYFQRRAYKLVDRAGATTDAWEAAPAISTLPINTLICRPRGGERLCPGPIRLAGYAWSGEPGGVAAVEFSVRGGAGWRPARLSEINLPGCWREWTAEVDLASGRHDLLVRALLPDGSAQPADPAPLWNARGYMNNSWARAVLEVRAD
ncbi:MAG: Sulfite oxidase [bacterium]|nr:MAG: Sulfite oxidase [bacterium]